MKKKIKIPLRISIHAAIWWITRMHYLYKASCFGEICNCWLPHHALQHSLPCFTARSAAVSFCLPLPSNSAILLRHTGSVIRWDGALGGRGCCVTTKDHLGTTCRHRMQKPQPTMLEHLSASSLFTYSKGYEPSRCRLCQVLVFSVSLQGHFFGIFIHF